MVLDDGKTIFVGKGEKPEFLTLALANRHGLVTGATGTGKTVTLQVLAEGFSQERASRSLPPTSRATCPASRRSARPRRRSSSAPRIWGSNYQPDEFPAVFWDLYGEQGHPIRATVAEMGPLLLSRLLGLNETQEGVLNIAFRIADDQGLALLDLKDLRAMLGFHFGEGRRDSEDLRQRFGRLGRQPSSGSCWCSRTRAPTSSSASRRSISRTSCAPTATGAASSTCSPPTS